MNSSAGWAEFVGISEASLWKHSSSGVSGVHSDGYQPVPCQNSSPTASDVAILLLLTLINL